MTRLLAISGLLIALFSAQAFGADPQKKKKDADTTVRSVQGMVADDSDQPVAGAVVQLKNTKTQQIRSYITKDDGSYAFHGLSTNVDYELKANRQGLISDAKTLSVFDSRNKAIINLKLNKK